MQRYVLFSNIIVSVRENSYICIIKGKDHYTFVI